MQRDPQKADIHDIPNIFAEDREKIHPKMAELCDGETYKKNPENRQSFRRIILVGHTMCEGRKKFSYNFHNFSIAPTIKDNA